ncbi:MAG TPA: FMN-binding protein [Kribbellaceae bacterium]|nr:FMN-binding protein [Kribbellaceae bacterium]
MKRILTWLLSTIAIVVLLFGYRTSTSGSLATGTTVAPVTSGSGTSTTSGSGGSSGSSKRTVTGPVVQTRWGPVQVQLTVSGGRITAVDVVRYPNGNHKDEEINDYALPVLVQSTLDAQSASIDMVSGATVTSSGYVESLQGALDEAGL